MTPWFFGYGSLANRKTHAYPQAQKATLRNWRRTWVGTDLREVVFLSIHPAPGHSIDGLIAAVPGADWAALDTREAGYTRFAATDHIAHSSDASEIAAYQIPNNRHRPDGSHCMLLSYLDVVVQGFLHEFGQEGAEAFFATTDNWDTPVHDDRGAPLYSRAQDLTRDEHKLVDQLLAQVQ